MAFFSDKRLALAWIVLVGMSLLSWAVGSRHGTVLVEPEPLIGMIAIAITLVKVRVIIRQFMEVRSAPVKLKYITDAWIATFGLAMVVAYFI